MIFIYLWKSKYVNQNLIMCNAEIGLNLNDSYIFINMTVGEQFSYFVFMK